jgi:DNA-binding NarL/FixJ family response regulator
MSVRILLADDSKDLRNQLRTMLESRPGWHVIGEAVNGRDAVQKTGQLRPDVLLIDYSMPELDGISAISEIHRTSPDTEIIMLTVHDARFTVGRAVDAGARGYVVKSQIVKDLIPAVEAASQHRMFLSFLGAEEDHTPPARRLK